MYEAKQKRQVTSFWILKNVKKVKKKRNSNNMHGIVLLYYKQTH